MPDFDPGQAAIRVALQNAAGVPPLISANAWKGMDFISESLSAQYPLKESASIRGVSQRRRGNPAKIAVGGEITCELHTEMHYLYLAHLQRNWDGGTASGSAYAHVLAPKETDTAIGALALDIFRDDGMDGHVFNDVWVNSWNLALAIDQYVISTFNLVGRRADYWDDPVADTGAPTLTSLRLRGLPDHTNWTSGSIVELAFQVDASDATVLKAVWSNGTPSFVGSTTFTITVDTWTRVTLTDGSVAGSEDNPIWIYVPSGALSTSDEFHFDIARGTFTPDFSSLPGVLDEIFITVSVDGVEECIEGLDLTVEQPLKVGQCIGGRYPNNIRRIGMRSVTGSFSRDYLSVAFRKRLERAKSFSLRVEMKNGEEIPSGGANEQYEIDLYMPLCVLQGPTKTISGPEDSTENLEFIAYNDPDEGSGDTDDLTITLTNGDSDITD